MVGASLHFLTKRMAWSKGSESLSKVVMVAYGALENFVVSVSLYMDTFSGFDSGSLSQKHSRSFAELVYHSAASPASLPCAANTTPRNVGQFRDLDHVGGSALV